MNFKIIIPVIDTEQGKFEYKGRELTREEYGNMEYEKFRRTNGQMNRFVDNMRNGISNVNPYGNRFREVKDTGHPDVVFKDEEADVIVKDASLKREITEEELLENVKSGKMFIIVLNIVSNTLSFDAESEIRFWMEDSKKVINDKSLPDNVKMKTLLGRDYGLKSGDKTIWLTNCKMVKQYQRINAPYCFAVIVEKAIL